MRVPAVQAAVEILTRPWVASCGETEAHLSGHLDGDLSRWRERRLLRHLARCERCRAMLESFRRTVEQLRLLGRPDAVEAQPALAEAVLERIRRESRYR
jgi:predicted anti-sigma-YlaC factor YlaD